MTTTKIHYANPSETCFTGACFEFHFGAYGCTVVRVFQRPGYFEDALEIAAEWLSENAPGHIMQHGSEEHMDLIKEKCEERGLTLEQWQEMCDAGDGTYADIAEDAEADLTYTEAGFLTSYEWTVREMSDTEIFPQPRFVRQDIVSAYYCYWKQYGYRTDGFQTADAAVSAAQRMGMGINPELPTAFEDLSENGQAIYRKLVLTDGR